MNDPNADLALFLALNCVRNTEIEDLHAGTFPSSKAGDFSDVKVVTPFGDIPWNELSRISDDEMCSLNKSVVNKLYTALDFLTERGFLPANAFTIPSHWDAPEIDVDLREGWELIARRISP